MLACAVLAVALTTSDPTRFWKPPADSWDPTHPAWMQGTLTSWLTLAALLNAVLLFSALNPDERIMVTDGSQLIDWIWGGRDAERTTLLVGIAASSRAGVRARDWDAALIERALAYDGDGRREDVLTHLFAYYQAVDRGEVERAGELLDYALKRVDQYPAEHRAALTLEGAYYEGFFRRDAAKARNWFERPGARKIKEQTRLRAEAAVLLAEGDFPAAVAKAEAGLAVVMNSEDAGGAISETDWLDAIVTECRRNLETAIPVTASPTVPRS